MTLLERARKLAEIGFTQETHGFFLEVIPILEREERREKVTPQGGIYYNPPSEGKARRAEVLALMAASLRATNKTDDCDPAEVREWCLDEAERLLKEAEARVG